MATGEESIAKLHMAKPIFSTEAKTLISNSLYGFLWVILTYGTATMLKISTLF